MKKILLADDHPIFRAGLRQFLEEDGQNEIIAETGNGKSCISLLEMLNPDVVVLDLAMPEIDGYGVLKWMKTNTPNIVGIIVSMHSSLEFAQKAKELGARAFVAKEDAGQELQNAMITPKGVFYISASVDHGATNKNLVDASSAHDVQRLKQLTPSEQKIFQLVAKNLTSRQIGEKLGLSHRTIQTHRQKMVQKLELSGSNQLLEFAIRHEGTSF